MTTGHYQVLGASVPPLLGRASLMRTITDHLLKPSPDHVSVVGPAYYGKSVVLRHLATSFLNGSGSFLTASHIDLRHGIPASDGEFKWRNEWQRADLHYADDDGRLPRSPGAQCNILRLATGTERTSRQCRFITKTTYLLLDHLQSVGNFGQHRSDSPEVEVTVGFAASVVFAAISLVECLAHDLAAAGTG